MSGDSAVNSVLGTGCIARTDIHSFMANPASLAIDNGTQFINSYEDRFSGNVRKGSSALSMNDIGLRLDYFNVPKIEKRSITGELTGETDYNEVSGAAYYGFDLSKAFLVGIGLSFFSGFSGDQKVNGFTGNTGAIFKPADEFALGAVIDNIGFQTSYSKGKNLVAPLTIKGGVNISLMKQLDLVGGVSFLGQAGTLWSLGTQYTAYEHFIFRAGVDLGHKSYGMLTAGLGVNISNRVQLDYSFRAHQLGITNGLTFTVALKKKVRAAEPVVVEPAPPPKPQPPVEVAPKVVKEQPKPQVEEELPSEPEVIVITNTEYIYVIPPSTQPPVPPKSHVGIDAGTFLRNGRTLSEMTDKGKEKARNAGKMIRYLLRLEMINPKSKIIIEANASTDGKVYIGNEYVAVGRMISGMEVLADTLGLENLRDRYELRPMGARQSQEKEDAFSAKWRRDHNGEDPSPESLELFRVRCRNFKFLISLDLDKWATLRTDPQLKEKMDKEAPGLYGILENAYQDYAAQ